MPQPEMIARPPELPAWLFNSVFSINRWLHLVASTMLVGGVLFFVFVVPIATADLKAEQQVTVFGRARWMFRKVVGWSLVALVVTGCLSLWRMWTIYSGVRSDAPGLWSGSAPWAVSHLAVAVVGAAILVRVTATRKIHGHPVPWMWVVLALLLIDILLASISRQMRLDIDDRMLQPPHVLLSTGQNR